MNLGWYVPILRIITELKQRRRRRQRERRKKTIFRFLLGKQFHVFSRTTTTFFFFSWTSIHSFRIHLQKNFANIWRIKRVGISVIKYEAALIHFLSDVFVAVIVVLKLPIRIREIAELGRLLTKTPSKGALIGRRALIESLRYLCQGLVNWVIYECFVFEWVIFHFFCVCLFVCFLYLIFNRINVFNRGRIVQSVERLTTEWEVAGSFLGAGPLLRVLK